MRDVARGRRIEAGARPRRLVPAPARNTLELLRRAALLLDALAMVFVALTAVLLRAWLGWFDESLYTHGEFWLAGTLILGGWIGVIAAMGGYRLRLFGAGVEEYKIIANASLVTAGLTGVGCFLAHFELSRSFFFLVFALGAPLLVAERALARRVLYRARRSGRLTHDVVLAGSPGLVDEISRVLSRESWLGYRVRGAIVPPIYDSEETVSGTPILGTTDRLQELVIASNADVVFVAGGALDGAEQMRDLVWGLEKHDIQVVVAPSVTDVSRERVRIRPVGGLPLIHIDPPRHVRASRRAKRVFDLAVSAALVFAVAPVFIFIALAIKLHDRGPVFFKQTRTGRDGLEFSCLKFRSMVTDAEAKLAMLHEEQGFEGGLFKMKDDPRITRPGRWLRRYSLDELPQLINVLRGDMSLVGPRPPLPTEVAAYDRFSLRRLHVRPGMTGLWQVSGRSDLSTSEAIRLDLYYVDNWSMLQDLSILAKTFGAVFGTRGAY